MKNITQYKLTVYVHINNIYKIYSSPKTIILFTKSWIIFHADSNYTENVMRINIKE